jgi:hypothetical protein
MKDTLVLFDVGAVLLELKYVNVYQAGAEISGRSVDEFRNLSSELEVDVLNGNYTYEEHQKRIREILRKPDMTRGELEDFVKQTWGGEITPVVDLKERVYFKGDCPVNIFSNIDRFAFEYLSRTYPRMMQTFRPDAVPICSYSSKGTKPHSLKMYNKGIRSAKKLGCNNVILIDDKESVLQLGIEQFGWYGVHFTPYIDQNEAIRLHSQNETSFTSEKLFVANSVGELEQALTNLGINL